MLGQQFYHETIRKIVIAFGTMFNDIQLIRKDNSGTVVQTISFKKLKPNNLMAGHMLQRY